MTPADIEDTDATIERLTRERDEALERLDAANRMASFLPAAVAQKESVASELRELEDFVIQMPPDYAAALKRAEAAEAQRDEALALLRECEHVWLPGMPAQDRRCPSCRSPLDLSQPHEAGCRLDKALRGGA